MCYEIDIEVYKKIQRTEMIYKNPHPSVPGYRRRYKILLSDVLYHFSGMNTVMKLTQGLWNLQKPTYEEQSEECKEFIRNLVK